MRHHLFRPDTKTLHASAAARRRLPTGKANAGSDTVTVAKVLNQALRIAELTILACKRQYHIALRHHSPPLAGAALEHANDAKLHADRIRQRIQQLGGTPDTPPDAPFRSRASAQHGDPNLAIISEHLIASRAAVESYNEIAEFFAPFDPDTRQLLDEIAAGERERGDDLARLQRESAKERAQPLTPTLSG